MCFVGTFLPRGGRKAGTRIEHAQSKCPLVRRSHSASLREAGQRWEVVPAVVQLALARLRVPQHSWLHRETGRRPGWAAGGCRRQATADPLRARAKRQKASGLQEPRGHPGLQEPTMPDQPSGPADGAAPTRGRDREPRGELGAHAGGRRASLRAAEPRRCWGPARVSGIPPCRRLGLDRESPRTREAA